jgi:transmembrane protein TMEM174 (potassium channel)
VIRWVRWLAMARAPGGKAGADSPSVHRDVGRLVAFSDAVFAITVTLLVLEIRPPTDYSNLLHGLLALWPSYLAYGVTFLFIGQVWANHHVMFDHIRTADRGVLLFNTLLLMAVAFLPFATSVLAGALRKPTRRAYGRLLLRHRVRRDGADIQRRVAVRAPSPAAQRRAWPCWRDSNQQALSACPSLAHGRRPAGRGATRLRRGRDRGVQRLLLASDPGRESTAATLVRARTASRKEEGRLMPPLSSRARTASVPLFGSEARPGVVPRDVDVLAVGLLRTRRRATQVDVGP